MSKKRIKKSRMDSLEKGASLGKSRTVKKKVTKISSINIFKEMEGKEKHLYYRIYLFFYRLFYRIIESPRNTRRAIVRFFQRAIRGWADEDTWGLCYYLSDVISKSVYHLKKEGMSMPNEVTEGQWVDILNEIRDTFDIAKRIINDDLYLIEDEDKRKKWQKTLDKINKKHKTNNRCMSDEEIIRYERGWRLFKKYFFDLWD